MEVLRFGSSAELAEAVAQRFVTFLIAEQSAGKTPQVALTGGTIAGEIYAAIPRATDTAAVNWTSVGFWWGDERFLPADSPDRNARQARGVFLDQLGATRIHEMPTPNSACSLDEGARAYEAELRAVARFDLTMLSMGPDGHIASLFPGRPLNGGRVVGVSNATKPPAQRLSLTLDALNNSEHVWVFAADSGPGGAKEAALRQVLDGDTSLPATQVHGRSETLWFCS